MAPQLLSYLDRATIVNQFGTTFPASDILKDQHIILLYFASVNDTDADLLARLRRLYEAAYRLEGGSKLRMEVLHVPIDVDPAHGRASFAAQAGLWYSLVPGSLAITELLVFFNVIGTPTIMAVKPDGSLISRFAERDLRLYGSNALTAWSY